MRKFLVITALFLLLVSISVVACAGVPTDPVSLVVNYAMWSEMLGCELAGEPQSYNVAGHAFLMVDSVSIEYDPNTLDTVTSGFELMDMEKESSSDQILEFMAYIAAHEFGELPEDFSGFQSAKAKLLELQEMAVETLEQGISQIIAGKNLPFYSGENFEYVLYMNRDLGTICVLATPQKTNAE